MRNRISIFFIFQLVMLTSVVFAAKPSVQLKSPNGKIAITLAVGTKLLWSVKHETTQIIDPSGISLTLNDGTVLGNFAKVISIKNAGVRSSFKTPFYKKSSVTDEYNQITIHFKGQYGLVLRAYDDGVSYRFLLNKKGMVTISSEEANFNFNADYRAFIPYIRDLRDNERFTSPFEAMYNETALSKMVKDSLALCPLLIDYGNGKKAIITEAALEDYPGMFLKRNAQKKEGLQGVFANYPLEEHLGGFQNINYMVTKRAPFIAKINGTRALPWRTVIISEKDKDLLNNDMVQQLSAPVKIADTDWIKPGKVAWDWWNDWNISKVDFKAGINTQTYKYYIDFASANGIEYIIVDEGWSEENDLQKILPQINIEEIVDYGKQKKVGVMLWASWYSITKAMDKTFSKYAALGVKGFKIDFLDRDDQKMVKSVYDIAENAAKYKLLVDYHGMYKPTGIQRTYPNVLNFEGVKGLENVKWTANDDVPKYDVSIPFIRMVAGPMDYTPGAMRNATREGFRPSNSLPMSQGTRCHQLAAFVVFEAPLQMMCDSPTAYLKEQESTSFISQIPTTFDETVAIDGEVGEFVAIARRKGDKWFVGGLSNWSAREIIIDLSFLKTDLYQAEIFQDGINAEKDATDYKRTLVKLSGKDKLTIKMAKGGGFAIRFNKIK